MILFTRSYSPFFQAACIARIFLNANRGLVSFVMQIFFYRVVVWANKKQIGHASICCKLVPAKGMKNLHR